MTKSYRLIIVLTVTAILSGLLLSLLNLHTSPLIEAYQNKVLNEALSSVLPGSDKINDRIIENKRFYFGYDKQGNITGIAFLTEGNGFQSKLRILVGTDSEMTRITKIRILEQKETPGLGTKIDTDPSNKANPQWFSKQFEDLNIGDKVSYVKNQTPDKSAGQIMAITGATISSKAVVDIINSALIENKRILSKNTDLNIGQCPDIESDNGGGINPENLPEGAESVSIEGKTYYISRNDAGEITNVAFVTSGEGFQSKIKVMACMSPDFKKMLNLKILEQNETQGWGSRLLNDTKSTDPQWFLKQFNNLNTDGIIKTVATTPNKLNGEVAVISEATVSSEAVINMLNESIQEYRDTYQNRKVN